LNPRFELAVISVVAACAATEMRYYEKRRIIASFSIESLISVSDAVFDRVADTLNHVSAGTTRQDKKQRTILKVGGS
jgi:hypothetical protein